MMFYPPRIVPAMKTEIPKWLDNWSFDLFVTLTTNGATLPRKGCRSQHERLTDLLKEWDGRMNRKLAGPKWRRRIEDRMWAFYFLEKPASNPHWHGLVQLRKDWPGMREKQWVIFEEHCGPVWKKLVPAGTVDIKPIFEQRGIEEYVAKTLQYPVSYEHFVTPDLF